MKEEKTYPMNANPDGHLGENELAQFAEFLRRERDELPEEIRQHAEECAFCRAEAMEVADLLDQVQETEDGSRETGDGRQKSTVRRLPSVIRLVASIAAILVVAWVIQQLRTDRSEQEKFATVSADSTDSSGMTPRGQEPDKAGVTKSNNTLQSDRTSGVNEFAVPDTVRYAQAFVPNPTYESLLSAGYRSAANPKATGPGPETVFSPVDTLRIAWTSDPNDSYSLVIVDNQGKSLIEIKSGQNSEIAWQTNLKPGLYYWKLLGKGDLWKVGRFRILVTN